MKVKGKLPSGQWGDCPSGAGVDCFGGRPDRSHGVVTDPAGPRRALHQPDGGAVALRVVDTGPCIEADVLPYEPEPFCPTGTVGRGQDPPRSWGP